MDTIRIKLNLKYHKGLTEEMATEAMNKALDELIKQGALRGDKEKFLKDYDILIGPTNCVLMDIDRDAYIDAAPLISVGAEKISSEVIPTDSKSILEANRVFSQATINERMRLARMEPRQKCRYTIMDYKRYYAAHKDKLVADPDEFKKLRNMFITDMTGMFTEILPLIQEGKQLNALLGLQVVAPSISKSARDLSIAYRRALNSMSSSGAPTPALFKMLNKNYNEFIVELVKAVFPGIENVEVSRGDDISEEEQTKATESLINNEENPENKEYSYTEDGRIDLFNIK